MNSLRVLLLLLIPLSVRAEYIQPDLVDVPIGRIVSNLQAKLKQTPGDAKLRHQLARSYAMAYAKNLDADGTVKQWRGKTDTIWFGYEPPNVPYATRAKQKEEKSKTAKANLKRAIDAYGKALKLKPDDAVLRLGYGWCLKEAGDRKAAGEFRKVIDAAWKTEGKAQFAGMKNFVAVEAIEYLSPLLNPAKNGPELASLIEKRKKLMGLPRPITPIAIPLRDGLGPEELVNRAARVAFDLDGSGCAARPWQWLRPGNAAWLVHDPRGNGDIRSGLQLFGSRSFNLFLEHGYEALALLDDNQDGELRDAELHGLSLWNDRNANGKSEPGEVLPLSAWNIVALGCDSESGAVRFSPKGVVYGDGATRPSYDLVMQSR